MILSTERSAHGVVLTESLEIPQALQHEYHTRKPQMLVQVGPSNAVLTSFHRRA